MKKYFWFNLMCLSISAFLIMGTFWVWIYVRTTNTYEITNYGSRKEIEKLGNLEINNVTIQQFNNEVVTTTSTTEERDPSVPPRDYQLSVPFTSQAPEKIWTEPWQDACEEAALLMLDAYYKNYNLSPLFAKDEILKMVSWETEKGWGISIPIVDIKQMAEEYFHLDTLSPYHLTTSTSRQVKIIENPTIEQIKKSIVAGNPVLAVADGKILPNPNFRNGGPVYHALIIKGYTETDFITNDPGTQFGADFKYKYQDLLNAIHDWNGGQVSIGKKVVMIIEN